LNKNITNTNISIRVIIEKIIQTAVSIKLFISLRLIPNESKNLTSSTVLAFITIKLINAHHNVKAINIIAHKNPNIVQIEVFLTCFLTTFFFCSTAFIKIFSPSHVGAVLAKILYDFPENIVSQLHS
jgi:hypothetical protein